MTEKDMKNFYKNNCERNIQRITLFNCEYNYCNGFMFTILELNYSTWDNSHDLFSISISKDFFIIEILFIKITLYDRTKRLLSKYFDDNYKAAEIDRIIEIDKEK